MRLLGVDVSLMYRVVVIPARYPQYLGKACADEKDINYQVYFLKIVCIILREKRKDVRTLSRYLARKYYTFLVHESYSIKIWSLRRIENLYKNINNKQLLLLMFKVSTESS